MSNSHPIRATGMVWYEAQDFDRIKSIMEDGHVLHRTYAEWKAAAEMGEKRMRRDGVRVYRAIINPSAFTDWCNARGLKLNADSRNQFASWHAAQEYRAGR